MTADDERLEAHLRRMRPVGPPVALRRRVLTATPTKATARSSRLWLTAAAILLVAAFLRWQTARYYAALADPQWTRDRDAREQQVDLVAAAWGGSAAARDAAVAALDALENRPSDASPNQPAPGGPER